MALTTEQRENRALFNLQRASEPLTRGQLYCASVRDEDLATLTNERLIETHPCGGYAITFEGELELMFRIANARASTISAVAA